MAGDGPAVLPLPTEVSPSSRGTMASEERRQEGLESEPEVELVAPEGGWGYMVAIGFSFLFIVVSGPLSNFGMIFNDFFEITGYGTSGLTLVNGVYNAVVSFTGFSTTYALKTFSLRQVGLFGSFMFVLGSVMIIFTKSVPYLVFSAGVLQGIGFGTMMPIILTSFNNYFVKRRVAFMGMTSVIVAAGFMTFPAIIKFLMEYYGFRGTLIILSGISLHTILCMVVMQPVEWHLVPRIRPPDDSISDVADNNNTTTKNELSMTKQKVINEKSMESMGNGFTTINEKEVDGDKREPLLISSLKGVMVERRRSTAYGDIYESHREIIQQHSSPMVKASSLASLGNWASPVLAAEAVSTKSGRWQTFVDSFDLNLLKDPVYSNMCFGMSFAFFSEITFFVLEPVLLYHYGFSQAEVAICVTAGAGADLVFRVLLAIYTFRFTVNSRYIFFTGTCCIMVLRIVFMQYQDFYHVVVLTACLGVFRSWVHVFLPLVFAENCPEGKFPTAYGLFMMISGIITFSMSVIVGFIRDYTNSYTLAFHFLTFCCCLLIVPWSAEFYYYYKNKRKVNQ